MEARRWLLSPIAALSLAVAWPACWSPCGPSAALGFGLQKARDEVREEKPAVPSRSHSDRRRDDGEGSFLGDLFGNLVFGIVVDGVGARSYGAEPRWESYFARYPYANGYDGFMMSEQWMPTEPRMWSARAWFEHGNDFSSLQRFAGNLMLENQARWAFDAEWSQYVEQLPDRTDTLALGDVNAMYRLIETEGLQWRVGLGMNWMDDDVRTDYGFNFTMKADYYPRQPWVVSGEFDWGSLGRAEVIHGSLTVGLMLRRVEIFTGYDFRRIGSADLSMPAFGARIWF